MVVRWGEVKSDLPAQCALHCRETCLGRSCSVVVVVHGGVRLII